MHLIVPFAASLSEPCQQALTQWARAGAPALPNLAALLGRLAAHDAVNGDEYALNLPHEKVLGKLMGWPDDLPDGELPWAAWWAQHDGLALPPGETWALLSPGHWLMGRDHLTLIDPEQQPLTEAESRALFTAVLPFFESDGWTLQFGAPTRWYASHPTLAGLPTASLDRVIGRNPDVWLTDHPQARVLRRLQAEAQMLWYQHPLHDERQAQGLLPINSFWVSGCGVVRAAQPVAATVLSSLRAPLLADDIGAWQAAWQALDAGPLAKAWAALDAGQAVTLTLCGERHARTWQVAAPTASPPGGVKGWWQRLRSGRDQAPTLPVADVLAAL